MKSFKKTLVTTNYLTVLLALSLSNTLLADIAAVCRIDSANYLSPSLIDKYSPAYTLKAPPTEEGGRHLVFENERYELWLKTHAYQRLKQKVEVTAFAAVLIDKEQKTMVESPSSTQASPRRAELTAHHLNKALQADKRLIFTCVERAD